MPSNRFFKLKPEKRAHILAAARAEFVAHGFDGASYNRIISAAGVSKGAMYYYFEDKLDLYATVLADAFSEVEAAWAQEFDQGLFDRDFWAAVEVLALRQIQWMLTEPELVALSRGLTDLDPAMLRTGPLGQFYQGIVGWIGALVLKGQSQGAVRDDLPGELLVSILMGVGETFDRWWLQEAEGMDEEAMGEMVQTSLDIMRRIAQP